MRVLLLVNLIIIAHLNDPTVQQAADDYVKRNRERDSETGRIRKAQNAISNAEPILKDPYWAKVRAMSTTSNPSRKTNYIDRSNIYRDRSLPDWAQKAVLTAVIAGVAALALGIEAATGTMVDAAYGDEEAQRAVEGLGYTNVKEIGKNTLFVELLGCDSSDKVRYSFSATDAADRPVNVYICKGLWKDGTLRIAPS